MRLTQELLGYLNRVFSKDPQQTLAIQFQYAGTGMTWDVVEKMLAVQVTGGLGSGFVVDLEDYTLASLASFIAARPGFTVNAIVSDPKMRALSASVLLDGSGNQNVTGGKNLYCYTSNLYAYLEAAAAEIDEAERNVVEAIKQVTIFDAGQLPSAAGEWLDEIGGYYAVKRITGESDAAYGPRIVAEVLRPRGNNVALESAIKAYTGQTTAVIDASVPAYSIPIYNGASTHNSARTHNSTGSLQYNLFDVSVGYDLLNGGDISAFEANVTAVVERLRDAGTHMRSLLLTGSVVGDSFDNPPTDAFANITVTPGLADTLTAPMDSSVMSIGGTVLADTLTPPGDNTNQAAIVYNVYYTGFRSYNGSVPHAGGLTGTGKIDGSGTTYA